MSSKKIKATKQNIENKLLEGSAERAFYFSLAMSGLFAVFGFISHTFIQKFEPSISLWANVWPRIIFNSFPMLGIAFFLRSKKISSTVKINVWFAMVCVIFCIAACIHVWPIAMSGKSDILLYVSATNNVLFSSIFTILGLAPRFLIVTGVSYLLLAITPLAFVMSHSNDPVIFSSIIGDGIFLVTGGMIFGYMNHKLFRKVILLERKLEAQASQFLGPVVSKAIFQSQQTLLEKRVRKGFILSIDIRDSTSLLQQSKEAWNELRKAYFSAVSEIAAESGGYIQKTVGDCHLITFGIMDEEADLSDIPGLESEEARSEDRRLAHLSEKAILTAEKIFAAYHALTQKYFPEKALWLGAGLDKGFVEADLFGKEKHFLELDISGDAINCASRLQEYTKDIKKLFQPGASILVISQFASDYLSQRELMAYRKINTSEFPIRNYQNIPWVMARSYPFTKMSTKAA